MHVALVAPLVSPIHDDLTPLGGAQAFVGDLAHGLIASGHHVTLLAADGSLVRGADLPHLDIDSTRLTPADFSTHLGRTDTAEQTAAFARVRGWLDAHAADLDIVHGHAYDASCFLALPGLPTPVTHTLHLPPLDREVLAAVRMAAVSATYVAVSRPSADQWKEQGIPITACIQPGLKLESIPFRADSGHYLMFAGRITPEKGPDQAIDVTEALDTPLVLAGEIYDHDFYEQVIGPRVRVNRDFDPSDVPPPGATYVGPRSRSELLELMARATGLLMPSIWDEPFGLVGIEAQATGTPVVAYRRGGLIEVVAHGETGWLVTPDDRDELRARVQMLDQIDRRRCRQRIEDGFSIRRTVDQYIALYEQLAKEGSEK